MAGVWSLLTKPSPSSSLIVLLQPNKRIAHHHRLVNCCSVAPPPNNGSKITKPSTDQTQTPQLLKIAVTASTELLRLLSFPTRRTVVDEAKEEVISVLDVDDVLEMIKSDYDKAYFVTGLFTTAIYAEDCTFEDPTIKFQGRDLYARNLSLLVPFFQNPSIQLIEINKGLESESGCIIASWKLRTYLKLPWKPLIAVDGKTVYDLDENFRIVKHVESWNVSALEAVVQIFTPSS